MTATWRLHLQNRDGQTATNQPTVIHRSRLTKRKPASSAPNDSVKMPIASEIAMTMHSRAVRAREAAMMTVRPAQYSGK